ncbi:hypothetical protein A2697_01815 [Candidatus Curtissbacteria bacterium RIFCSPHIGHO2_01_FULL_41_44]|uniref:Glycosyltransferase RgtA/B/C/D-like domain-containing protein n=1 Tax=Candidatus Curtissbacteria bacterium RIFCSPLOWO2_01_FULL_42_50 TaxID=1797730 RepID=A0A1F5H6G7_9BACT|nr:MAG: hypothetical protein A2697_01815 [Candidatus Curtissbacteria bacterium RIFCSPHIGHO2_01_FULL_41_44]OGD99667.1 MAG: hypothetical protein A3B54_03190 [Candidatus Curtissbacteria bacterium RIFCSPLOWO2_01_FULL_42_50]
MTRKLIKFWPLGILLILTFLLRTIKLEELFYFTYDESVFAFVGRRSVLWNHIPLIGGATPFGFHVAPYFYWFFAFILWLGNLNPISWGWTGAVIAAVTTIMMYVVGSSFANKKVGITAAILWASSYLANVYDRHFWGLTFGPIFSLVILYCLYRIIKGSQKFVYILGISLALVIHADLSYYVFLAFTIATWIIFKLPIKKSATIALSFIFISFVPLVIFDVRHNLANIRPVADFIRAGRNKPGFEIQKFTDNLILFPRVATRFVYTFGDNQIAKQYSYCASFVSEKFAAIPPIFVIITSLALIYFIYWSWRKNKNSSWHLASFFLILYFAGIQIYGTIFKADIFEHYLTGIFSTFLLITALFISRLPKNLWLATLGFFVAANLYKFSLAQNSMGLKYKRQAIEYTMQQVGEKDFSLDSLSTCWKYSGYRYLFAVFGQEPVKSYVDPNFAYLYGTTPVAEKHPSTVVAFVIHDFAPETDQFYSRLALLKSHQISSALFGNVEVVIMNNSSGWFD